VFCLQSAAPARFNAVTSLTPSAANLARDHSSGGKTANAAVMQRAK
jgi:hypothetical protein